MKKVLKNKMKKNRPIMTVDDKDMGYGDLFKKMNLAIAYLEQRIEQKKREYK